MTTSTQPGPHATIDPATTLGPVALTVADLDGGRTFYEQALGLRTLARAGDAVVLGAEEPMVELRGAPDAPAPPRGSTGLFHLAVLVPGRAELALALRRVTRAGRSFTGASDHLVSEAVYLDDPEGNGVEIYRDRPPEQWPGGGSELHMATEPLDLQSVLAELPAGDGDPGMAPATRIGHVHLQVSDLGAAERFYAGVLGFEVMVRSYPGALFVAAGGYHHHIGLNTWRSRGGRPPPEGSRGLRRFSVLLPDAGELERVVARVRSAGAALERTADGAVTRDPSGNRVLLAVRAG